MSGRQDDAPPTVVQLVRRFGPVGGMENYVWHLSHAQAALGERVVVLCQSCHAEPQHPGVQVRLLGPGLRRPRWLAYLAFARQVQRALPALRARGTVVHSHERCDGHDVTTLHSEFFDRGVAPTWHSWLSPRITAYRWMERRELGLAGRGRVRVVPVSEIVGRAIRAAFANVPAVQDPIAPGVEAPAALRDRDAAHPQGGVIGFVGHEWRRKGLARVIEVATALKARRPRLQLLVVGPAPQEVAPMFQAAGLDARCVGWVPTGPLYPQMDVLLHPALSEAYGMVAPEAMAHGVPVVISDRCGAAPDVPAACGVALPLDAPTTVWAEACEAWLAHGGIEPPPRRTWNAVARDYQQVYAAVRRSV